MERLRIPHPKNKTGTPSVAKWVKATAFFVQIARNALNAKWYNISMGKQGIFSYDIIIDPLLPPLADFHYTATAIIYKDMGNKMQAVNELKENWGQTGKIASDKATKRAKEWIDEQQ